MVERDRALNASRRLSRSLSGPLSPRSTDASSAPPALTAMSAGMRYAFSGVAAIMQQPGSPRRRSDGAAASPQRPQAPAAAPGPPVPGAVLLQWARSTAGADAIEAVYARSADLDGDGVVLFIRSLCALSTQELQPLAGAPPRVTSLQRLAECLLLNMARIRLVWRRVWAVAAPHFVAAACHEDLEVSLVAVNALKQLVARLLQRSELEQFQWQGAALRPFVDVMRHASEEGARAMAMQCMQQFLRVRVIASAA